MLLTWRATVFSLMNSPSAMALLVFPDATRFSTSTSRGVSPAGVRFVEMAIRFRFGGGLQPLERAPGLLQLRLAGLPIPESAAGAGDLYLRLRGLIGSIQLAPCRRCSSQGNERRLEVLLREEENALRRAAT